jgi:hypothetical protein
VRSSNTTTVEGGPSLPTAPSEQVSNTTSVEGGPSLPTAPSEQVSNTTTAGEDEFLDSSDDDVPGRKRGRSLSQCLGYDDDESDIDLDLEFSDFANRGRTVRRVENPTTTAVSSSSSSANLSAPPRRTFTRLSRASTTPVRGNSSQSQSQQIANRTPLGTRLSRNGGTEEPVISLFPDNITQDSEGPYVCYLDCEHRSTEQKAKALAHLVIALFDAELILDSGVELKARLKEEFLFFRFGNNEEKKEIYRTCKDPHHAKGITFDVKQATTDADYVVRAVKRFHFELKEVGPISAFCADMIEKTLEKQRRPRARRAPPPESSSSSEETETDDPESNPTETRETAALHSRRVASLQSVINAIKTLQSARIISVDNMEVLDTLAENQDISSLAITLRPGYKEKLVNAVAKVYSNTSS